MISLVVVALVFGAASAHHSRYHIDTAYPYYQPSMFYPSAFRSYPFPQYSAYSPAAHYPINSFAPPAVATPLQAVAPVAPTAVYASRTLKPVAILRQSQDNNFDGTFSSDYQGENGITNSVSGYVKAISPKEQAQVMQGEYSYTAPDGTPIITRWYADETGFHAEGAHLPVAPPVPEAIAKSLARQAV